MSDHKPGFQTCFKSLRIPALAVALGFFWQPLPETSADAVGGRKLGAPLKYAFMNYSDATPAQMAWMNQRFTLKVSGNSPKDPSVLWMGYYDLYGLGSLQETRLLKDWALDRGIRSEEILLHSKRNFTSGLIGGSPAWVEMDRFDNFEFDPERPGHRRNGVLVETAAGTFFDMTDTSYTGQAPYPLDGNLYLGYAEPFDRATFVFKRVGKNVVGTWQYWNGLAWTALAVSDGTRKFSRGGTLVFTPPADWSVTQVNGSLRKYFVRFSCPACVIPGTKLPLIATVKGDDWRNGGPTSCRGWNKDAPGVVNRGTALAYNPRPPAGASARFPYQARIPFWSSNEPIANPADFQLIHGVRKRTWANFLADRASGLARENGWSGLMGDDAETDGNFNGVSYPETDFADKTTQPWAVENHAKLVDLVREYHQLAPSGFLGVNAQGKNLVKEVDWNLAEYHTAAYRSEGGILADAQRDSRMAYDDYLPENNPRGTIGLLIYADTAEELPLIWAPWEARAKFNTGDRIKVIYKSHSYWFRCTRGGKSGSSRPQWRIDGSIIVDGAARWVFGGGYIPWDRANRGPMAALSKHLIAANEYTLFSYYSRGGFVYDETDDVVLADKSTRAYLATQPAPRVSEVYRWGPWFPAMGADFGLPDPQGHHGGKRDLAWKTSQELGGGPEIWRRDYTHAIALHRPGDWTLTAEQAMAPSPRVELGGIYYPLFADGTTGPGVTSVTLRYNEGLVLLKSPRFAPVE